MVWKRFRGTYIFLEKAYKSYCNTQMCIMFIVCLVHLEGRNWFKVGFLESDDVSISLFVFLLLYDFIAHVFIVLIWRK